jgi:hypothetical protein
MFRTGLLLVALPLAVGAQRADRSGLVAPAPAGVTRAQTKNFDPRRAPAAFQASHFVPAATGRDTMRARTLGRYTLTGLSVGGVVGIIGGAVGSHYAGCGCSEATKVAGFALWFGALGAGAGAILGAIAGAIHDYGP